MGKECFEEKLKRVTAESVKVVEYDASWAGLFEEEKERLIRFFPGLVVSIFHFGSTAVPGLAAKPVIDMVIEVADLEKARIQVPAVLEPLGYDCFWRPSSGDDVPPWYLWCIRRNDKGERTHHLHFGEPGFKDAELQFRDILRSRPDIAHEYGELKKQLAFSLCSDRVAYTEAKTDFIRSVLQRFSLPA